jgi:hypothetical protein
MLVIRTSVLVCPAIAHVEAARWKGARVTVVGTEMRLLDLGEQDWYFEGDAAELVMAMVEPLVSKSD